MLAFCMVSRLMCADCSCVPVCVSVCAQNSLHGQDFALYEYFKYYYKCYYIYAKLCRYISFVYLTGTLVCVGDCVCSCMCLE